MNYEKIMEIVANNIDDGIFIVNKEGRVVFYNESANNQAGVTVDNALGKHMLEIFPKLTEDTSSLLRVLKTGEPIIGDILSYYNSNLKKVTILSTTLPIYEEGDLVGAVEIAKDMGIYGEFNEKINKIKDNKGIKSENKEIKYSLESIIGNGDKIKEVKKKIKKIANSNSPVMVTGETGTGKELVVQSIHNYSERCNKPFIAQNCAAIPVTLLESILFGTAVGSFTGSKDSPGLFELADGGTLFLDEINSMDLPLQAKLLRVIQDGCVRRIGGKETRIVNVRIITAMNITPQKALEEGKLREDMFFRLNVLNIDLPPLRERKEDLNTLINYFIKMYNKKFDKDIEAIDPKVMNFFKDYSWPGNIRELKHSIEHAVFMCENSEIKLSDLPENYKGIDLKNQKSEKEEKEKFEIDKPLKEIVDEYEKKVIVHALEEKDYSITKAAKLLGVPRQTLHYKINKLDITIKKTIE
jgi:arginine utilization regulatory protein